MSNTLDIDFSSDRLLSIASRMVDEKNYITALKMLNKNAGISGNDEDSYMLYAEIFDDLCLYEKSVHFWFKYLDVTCFDDYSECYEGLAVGYMNLGDERYSAYYYNKLLDETDGIDPDMREQLLQDFLTPEENPLKIVYPPELADVSQIMHDGVKYMKDGEFSKAEKCFNKVAEGNPQWGSARNYVAMCHIVEGNTAAAERECKKILDGDPQNIQALTTLAAVKTEEGNSEEALTLTQKLLSLKTQNADELYKIATVCCENKLHADAYALFTKIEGMTGPDLNLLYFIAVSAFNAKLFQESMAAFDKLLTVYPDAVTAEYWYFIAREMYQNGDWEELSYYYTLPIETKKNYLKVLAAYMSVGKKNAEVIKEELDLFTAIRWCFDSGDPSTSGRDLRTLAVHAAVRAGEDDYVRDLLLNPFLDDGLKPEIIMCFAERNETNSFGVVMCNMFRRITVRKLDIGRKKRKNFVSAYARLVARFSLLNNAYGEMFAVAAEKLYGRLQNAQKLELAVDLQSLTAVIFLDTGISDVDIPPEKYYEFFETDEQRLQAFYSLNPVGE